MVRMQTLGFSHYNLRAPHELLRTLRDFYCEIVGLQPGPRPSFKSKGFWLYAGEQDILHLTECPQEESRSTAVRTTFDHAAFNCRDRGAYEKKLEECGIHYDVDSVPQTGQFQIFFKDPAGNGVELNFADEGG